MVRFVRLRKQGNSWQVCLPLQLVKALGFRRADLLCVTSEGGRLYLARVDEAALARAAGAPFPSDQPAAQRR